MEWIQFGFSALCILIGLFVIVLGTLGSLKFIYVLNRMHSAAVLDTMGLFFISLGCAIATGFNMTAVKVMIVCFTLWVTSPICGHLIAKLEFITDNNLGDEVENDLKETKEENEDDII